MTTIQPIIVTPDLPRLRRFYEKVLGAAEFTSIPGFYVGLRAGEAELGLVADDKIELGTPQRILISVEVPDVDALLPIVEAAGGTVPGLPNDMHWGQRVAHVFDPDGNAVNLTCTSVIADG
jgi:predicted enzyme related to lactoylglutathione lyase